MNHFDLFGLPTHFELDGSLLSSQFRKLQSQFHPDNFATASERDRLMAMQQAAKINDAYQTLKDPITRAEYILILNGYDIRGEQQTLQDTAFLMEQMELREALHELETEAALLDFDAKVNQMYRNHLQHVQKELDSAQWEKATDCVRKLKFIAKLKNEVERVEEQLLG